MLVTVHAGWAKQEKKHCNGHKLSPSYPSLVAAKTACLARAGCSGVYDSSCDNSEAFYMCDSAYALSSSSSSCVYANPSPFTAAPTSELSPRFAPLLFLCT